MKSVFSVPRIHSWHGRCRHSVNFNKINNLAFRRGIGMFAIENRDFLNPLSWAPSLLKLSFVKSQIDIFNFDDQRSYLTAVLEQRKSSRATQSLRQLTQRAGFKSPATLSLIVNGKRNLSLTAAEKIAQALSLTGRRKRYLLELSRLDWARTEADKSKIRKELYRLKAAADENLMDMRQYRCLATWYYPVLYSLIGQKSFKDDPEWLSKCLNSEVSADEISQAIKDMEELGMIKKIKGAWKQSQGALTTRDDIRDAGIYGYHTQMLERAKLALELPLEDREFNGVTVCIPRDKLPFVKDRIRKFRKELNEFLSQFSDSNDVYQFNIQFFPHTKKETSSS